MRLPGNTCAAAMLSALVTPHKWRSVSFLFCFGFFFSIQFIIGHVHAIITNNFDGCNFPHLFQSDCGCCKQYDHQQLYESFQLLVGSSIVGKNNLKGGNVKAFPEISL